MLKLNSIKFNSDFLGVASSLLCLVHCLVMPVLIITGNEILQHEEGGFEWDYAFAILSLIAAYFSFKHSHNNLIKVSLIIAWILFVAGIFWHEHGNLSLLMHGGSVMLITVHIINFRLCRKQGCEVEYNIPKNISETIKSTE